MPLSPGRRRVLCLAGLFVLVSGGILPARAQTPTAVLSRSTVPGGYGVTLTIDLGVSAPKAGVTFRLVSSTPAAVQFAASGTGAQTVTIFGGQRTTSVALRIGTVTADTRVALSATSATTGATIRTFLLVQPLRTTFVSVGSAAVYGSVGKLRFTFRLPEPAPAGGLRLQIVSPSEAIRPETLTVAAGATEGIGDLTTAVVPQVTRAVLGATAVELPLVEARRFVQEASAPVVGTVFLYPKPVILSVTPSSAIVLAGTAVRFRIVLAPITVSPGTPLPDAPLLLVSMPSAAIQTKSVRYTAGQTEATTEHPVRGASGGPIDVLAEVMGSTARTTFQVVQPAMRVVSIQPARRTLLAGDSVLFTATLDRPVPIVSTMAIGLSLSGSSLASLNQPLLIFQAGAQTATFMVRTSALTAPPISVTTFSHRITTPQVTAGGVTAPDGSISLQPASATVTTGEFDLVKLPNPAISSIAPATPTLEGGKTSSLDVRFAPIEVPNGLSPAPTHTVVLTSSNPSVATAGSVQVASGVTSVLVPVTTSTTTSDVRVSFTASVNGIAVKGTAGTASLLVTPTLPRVTAVRATTTNLVPGDSVPVTVSVDRAAPAPGLTVLLTSTAPLALAVPSSISLATGATTATFFARAQPTVTVATAASISTPSTPQLSAIAAVTDGTSNTVFAGEALSTGPINIVPLRVSTVSFSPHPVFGGFRDVELTVRLSAVATRDITVRINQLQALGEPPSPCTLPSTLVVPTGSSEVRHRFSTPRVSAVASCPVSVDLANATTTTGSPTAAVALFPVPIITEIVGLPTETGGGRPLQGTVRFGSDAPIGTITSSTAASLLLTITSNNPAIQGTSVPVSAGAVTASFALPTTAVSAPTRIQLTFTLAGVVTTREVLLQPPPPRLIAWQFDRSTVIGGDTVTATLVLDRPALSAPEVITFSSASTTMVRPADLTIPVGSSRATVRVATGRVTEAQRITMTAAQRLTTVVGNVEDGSDQIRTSLTSTLTVEPLSVRQLLVDQPVAFGSVQRPNATLILNAPAPSGGGKVVLASSTPLLNHATGARLPVVLTVPGGADRITVALRTPQVQQLTDLTLSVQPAPDGSVDGAFTGTLDPASPQARSTPLQLLPIPILGNVRVEPATVVGGNAVVILGDLTNTVLPTLSTPTPPTLSMVVNSDRPDVVASSTVVVRPGETTVRVERPTTAITTDATVRFTITLVITRLSATLLVRHP